MTNATRWNLHKKILKTKMKSPNANPNMQKKYNKKSRKKRRHQIKNVYHKNATTKSTWWNLQKKILKNKNENPKPNPIIHNKIEKITRKQKNVHVKRVYEK